MLPCFYFVDIEPLNTKHRNSLHNFAQKVAAQKVALIASLLMRTSTAPGLGCFGQGQPIKKS